ncbi:MAG: hypothetical protein IT162_16090 [Bryobacterales bacterium]|nr:hypothetical protein [Bryobacterales bacterium]
MPIFLPGTDIYNQSLAALTMLFVIAVLLENAFALIFNWRVFLTYFNVAGVKTIVMFGVSLLVVVVYNVDILAALIAAYQKLPAPESTPVSKTVTAMILAGGSSVVNRIMVALGFRTASVEKALDPKPPADKAWIAVQATRASAVGPIEIRIQDLGPANANSPSPLAGTIRFRRPKLRELLWRNVNRFPPNGGYTVTPGVVYKVTAVGKDAPGKEITAAIGEFVFAPGAIADFDATL